MEQDASWKVATFYRFVSLDNLPAMQAAIKAVCEKHAIGGTLLIAPEGINGTVAGQGTAIPSLVDYLDEVAGIKQGELKYAESEERPFRSIRVRIKKEIITMRAPEANPTERVGTYVAPQNWNELIEDPSVTLVDTRNTYETAVGTFEGAIDPHIETFTEFKDYVRENMDPGKQKKVAMYCTGGIRCEKASSYMLALGFEEVYHLQGGILKYLEDVPADKSKWNGDCFVFDRRVAVGQNLKESPVKICFGCRFPLSAADLESASYEEGVSCPHCIDQLTPDRARSLRDRQQQMLREGKITR